MISGAGRKLALTAALGLTATLITAAVDAEPAAATATVVSHFVYRGSSDDTHADFVYLANGATWSQPNSLLFVTPNWNPGGNPTGTVETVPIAVWFDPGQDVWAAVREDGSTMPQREGFNVLVVPANKIGTSAFTVTSTAATVAGSSMYLDNPLLNGHPDVKLQVTQNLSPAGVQRGRNPHNIGVWYDSSVAKWAVFNEDLATMPAGVAFNVLVGQAVSNGGKAALLRTTRTNRSGDFASISNPQTTGNPNNVTFATHVWNANGATTGFLNDSQLGVFYDYQSDLEAVFNENGAVPHLGTTFDLLIFPS